MYIVPKQKWRYPMAIEREYAKDLVRYVEAEMKIVESLLPEMVEAVWRNRLQKDSFNNDGLGDWLGSLVKKVENKIAKVLSPVKAIEKTFTKVAKHVKEQFGGIFKSVFGAKPKAAKGEAVKLETMKNLWVNENLDLIKSVDRNVLDSVRRTLTEKVVAAADKKILMSELTAEIERLTGVSRTRAALIGADQVGKLHGRLARYKQMSEGIERYIWVTRGDSRVRPAHRVRHGVSYRWDSPPDGGHPGEAIRCRCVAQPCFDGEKNFLKPQKNSFIKSSENGIMTSEGGETMIHSELAIVKDNGIKNDYRVNFDLVNSKAYHDKFVGLTEHKALDEALYKQAAKMLEHRSGSEYEDIAMLDARTGKFLVGNDKASGDFKHKCGLSNDDANYLESLRKKFEILHNHPGSSIPSTADIEGLFQRENAVGSTVICHDGTVYRMIKNKPHTNIKQFLDALYEDTRKVHYGMPKELIELHATELAIEILVNKKYITYIKR